MSALRTALRPFVPPILPGMIDRWILRRGIRLSGPFPSWQAAVGQSDGYSAPQVLERVAAAAADARDGAAAYDQDGVTFAETQADWPLVALLYAAACRNNGTLAVLDYGGGLGNALRRNRPFLTAVNTVSWAVVEQPEFVRIGRDLFETPELIFEAEWERAIQRARPTVLLLGSVLQYLPDPFATLAELLGAASWDAVVVQRTPMWHHAESVAVQITPPWIYGVETRYPSWVFNQEDFARRLRPIGTPTWLPVVDPPLPLGWRSVEYLSAAAGACVRNGD